MAVARAAEWSINRDPVKDQVFNNSLGIWLAVVFRRNSMNDVGGGLPDTFVWIRQQARYGWQGRAGLWSKVGETQQSNIPGGFGLIPEKPGQRRNDSLWFNMEFAESVGSPFPVEVMWMI